MDGNPTVRLLASGFPALIDTPAIRRIAPRKTSVIFMIVLSFRSCGAGALAREATKHQGQSGDAFGELEPMLLHNPSSTRACLAMFGISVTTDS